MAIRQYVGARYVPKFDGDWDENKVYEPLTIVNYNNGSYTSKKEVTAGILPTNTEYWALTGTYNGQIIQLENEIQSVDSKVGTLSDLTTTAKTNTVVAINEVKSDITTNVNTLSSQIVATNNKIGSIHDIKTPITSSVIDGLNSILPSERKFVIFSDSYGQTVNGVTPYTYYLQLILPHSSDNGWYEFAESGTAFCRQGAQGHDVYGLIDSNLTNISNKTEITDIVLAFGINDRVQDISSLNAEMVSVDTLLKSNFPNATIWLAWLGNQIAKNDSQYVGYLNCISRYEEECVKLSKWKWCDGIQYVMHDKRCVNTDNIHPTRFGARNLARGMAQILNGNAYKYLARQRTTMTTSEGAEIVVDQTIDGNITNTWINNFTLNDDTNSYMGTSGGRKVGTISNSIIDYHTSQKQCVPIFAYGTTHNYFTATGYINNSDEIYHNIYSGSSAVETITSYYSNNYQITIPTLLF